MWQQISGAWRVRVRQQHTDAAHRGEKQQKHMHEFSTSSGGRRCGGPALREVVRFNKQEEMTVSKARLGQVWGQQSSPSEGES